MALENTARCRDFFGREIHPGATLVYAALVGRSAVLKSGQVVATEGQRITLEIDSEKRAAEGYVTVKRRVVLTFPERTVVISVES